jgi:DmsE family decaheme c-type cytochrome
MPAALDFRAGWVAVFALACLTLSALKTPAFAAPAGWAPAPPAAEALYSKGGSATCLQCHNSSPVSDILTTHHAVKGDSRTPFAQHDCESCHGPSAAHAEGFANGKPTEPDIRFNGPNASPVKARDEVCLTCHQNAQRINWDGSAHQRADVSCASCHTLHAARDPILAKGTQVEKCFGCHAAQRAQSFLYSHHPMREGAVVCSDCHNPHGSPGPSMVKEFTVNETCYNCHAEKRGPLLFEHQPVREDCSNCHTPHGSTEARLMKERTEFMCSSCHSSSANHSGGVFGGGNGLAGSALFTSALANNRTCLNCHSQVHGSNSPNGAYFFR